jgi:hypothetical protein
MDRKNERDIRNKDRKNSEEELGQIHVNNDEFIDWFFSPQSEEEFQKYLKQKRQIRDSQKRHPEVLKRAQEKYRRKKNAETE